MEFIRLTEVDRGEIAAVLGDPALATHMPLSGPGFDAAGFVEAKERIWRAHGYGPWAVLVDGRFAGWGGPQPEGDDVDLAVVLGRAAWGRGRQVHEELGAPLVRRDGVRVVDGAAAAQPGSGQCPDPARLRARRGGGAVRARVPPVPAAPGAVASDDTGVGAMTCMVVRRGHHRRGVPL
ncbi:GNAT family N-acetyltransferase [Actinokineospora bangkokensis]|uniref:GNAT family N-acetyltransferase n=1 Tax=Actinokineospora bangkokensis TaxID=1193682 RepID=UPI000A076261|nr:GNAT family N-acetyltransferase [Actinokineospora bangkokensis]